MKLLSIPSLPKSYKTLSFALMGIGALVILIGAIVLNPFGHAEGHGVYHSSTRFWAVMMQNSIFWLLVANSSMFFICATTLAMGGWQVALRRVPEAISTGVPILGIINLIVLLTIVWTGRHDIYHWLTEGIGTKGSANYDEIISGKTGLLNKYFYTAWSIITVFLWWFLGAKMRKISLESDEAGPMTVEEGGKWIYKNTVHGALFLVFFALTVGSTIPWIWIMSIDTHWYSTMFSWYTFISAWVSGVSLIAIYIIYLKNHGELELVSEEHLHDIGKFMFAFSVFWTYLWFSQYMLIWYSNQPEETKYFIERLGTHDKPGPYKGIFFLNIIFNFLCPLLILLRRGSKRSWTLVTFMAIFIIFGHWMDFYQMIMPGTVRDNNEMSWFEFGVPLFFIGIIMWSTGNYLTKHSLVMKNHPFLKESIIHHT